MRQFVTLLAILSLMSCKEKAEKAKRDIAPLKLVVDDVKEKYPEAVGKIFEAHGGIENWKKKHTLTFEIPGPKARERHTIDLHDRRDKIEIGEVAMGFDGSEIWLLNENNNYKGNPAVYHNLKFYFYAMPFVLADPGINYETVDELVYEGKKYPGYRISYNEGVGASPKDDYYLHYDPETYQMAWLGYTYTYGSDKKSDDVRWIRYKDWMKVDEVLLPKYLTWHNYEGRTIKEAKDPLRFEQVSLDTAAKSASFYARPENAKVVLKP